MLSRPSSPLIVTDRNHPDSSCLDCGLVWPDGYFFSHEQKRLSTKTKSNKSTSEKKKKKKRSYVWQRGLHVRLAIWRFWDQISSFPVEGLPFQKQNLLCSLKTKSSVGLKLNRGLSLCALWLAVEQSEKLPLTQWQLGWPPTRQWSYWEHAL